MHQYAIQKVTTYRARVEGKMQQEGKYSEPPFGAKKAGQAKDAQEVVDGLSSVVEEYVPVAVF